MPRRMSLSLQCGISGRASLHGRMRSGQDHDRGGLLLSVRCEHGGLHSLLPTRVLGHAYAVHFCLFLAARPEALSLFLAAPPEL